MPPARKYSKRHTKLLKGSAISASVATERGYVSIDGEARRRARLHGAHGDGVDTRALLEDAGFAGYQRRAPGLLIPIHGVTGEVVGHQYRPDDPRTRDGQVVKYEWPESLPLRLDVHPRVHPDLPDLTQPLWITEGARKVDAAVTLGLTCIGIPGVDGWRGEEALRDFESIALTGREVVLCFDADVRTNPHVRRALEALRRYLEVRGARARFCMLPNLGDGKTGLDDWSAAEDRQSPRARRRVLESFVVDRLPSDVYLTRASDIEPEAIEYLEESLIPLRVVTVVTGLDGVGKSTILYDTAARATRGELPGKFEGKPVDVVIASCEDHPGSVIIPRLIAARARLRRIHIVKVDREGLTGDIALPDDLDAVAHEVARVKARLLIIDPLVAHMPMNIDSHKAQHVRQVLAPLAHLAEERNLAVAAVVHFNKTRSTDARSRISGSKALRDQSRSVLICGEDPNDESRFVLVQDKFSFGPKSKTGWSYQIKTKTVRRGADIFTTSQVVWGDEVEITSAGLLADPEDPDDRSERDDAAEWLIDFLEARDGRRASFQEVYRAAREADIAERTLRRARSRAGVVVRRSGFPATSVWELQSGPNSQFGQCGPDSDAGRTGRTGAALDDEDELPYDPERGIGP